jgi:hypothetical protein
MLSNKKVYIFIHPMRATWISHLIFLNVINLIIFRKAYKLRSSSLCNCLQPLAASSLIVRNKVSHTHIRSVSKSFRTES